MARYILLFLGAVFIIYSVFVSARMKFNAGMVLIAICGVLLGTAGILYDILFDLIWFNVLFFFALAAILLLILLITCYFINDNDSGKEDAAIVLGSGLKGNKIGRQLKSRLDKALEYANKNKNAVIVVSGGMGKGETVTEAHAMCEYLVSKGINENRIIKENKSVSTYTNLVNSKKILERHFNSKSYNAVIITSNYHIFRAVKISKRLNLRCTHLHAPIPFFQIPVSYARECAAIIKDLVL